MEVRAGVAWGLLWVLGMDVNDKDGQELADAALWPAVTGFVADNRPSCPSPPRRFGWSVVALHDLLLYVIRTHQELDDPGTQGACGLSPWLPNRNIRAGFGCGDEFLGVWMGSLKFTFCRHSRPGRRQSTR